MWNKMMIVIFLAICSPLGEQMIDTLGYYSFKTYLGYIDLYAP